MTARFCPECGYVCRDDPRAGVRVVARHEDERTAFVAFPGDALVPGSRRAGLA
jgi:hypothetical protein